MKLTVSQLCYWQIIMANQLSLELPLDIPAQEARFLLAAKLYEVGRLSLGQAAELADYSKSTL